MNNSNITLKEKKIILWVAVGIGVVFLALQPLLYGDHVFGGVSGTVVGFVLLLLGATGLLGLSREEPEEKVS